MRNCHHGNRYLIYVNGPKMRCGDCGDVWNAVIKDVSYERALSFCPQILAKLWEHKATDLYNKTLAEALGECMLNTTLYRSAQILRDNQIIGVDDL